MPQKTESPAVQAVRSPEGYRSNERDAPENGGDQLVAQGDVVADRQLAFHPVAELFPLMHGEEFDALVADIQATGQRDPVVLHRDGRVLDGRNRTNACRALGIEPRSILWDGKPGEEFAYIISRNLHRRHLSTQERAKIAMKLATMKQGERTDLASNVAKLSQAQAAALMNVSRSSLQRGKGVEKKLSVRPPKSGARSKSRSGYWKDMRKAVESLCVLPAAADVVRGHRGWDDAERKIEVAIRYLTAIRERLAAAKTEAGGAP